MRRSPGSLCGRDVPHVGGGSAGSGDSVGAERLEIVMRILKLPCRKSDPWPTLTAQR